MKKGMDATFVKEREVQTGDNEMDTESFKRNRSFVYRVVKRIFDFVVSLCISVVILIPCIVIALIISLKDHGCPLYKQKRVGMHGKPLYLWKFRSMKKGADNLETMLTPEQVEEYKREYKLSDDPRLIGYKKPGDGQKCFGAKIRTSSIDELPQFFLHLYSRQYVFGRSASDS